MWSRAGSRVCRPVTHHEAGPSCTLHPGERQSMASSPHWPPVHHGRHGSSVLPCYLTFKTTYHLIVKRAALLRRAYRMSSCCCFPKGNWKKLLKKCTRYKPVGLLRRCFPGFPIFPRTGCTGSRWCRAAQAPGVQDQVSPLKL